MTPSDQSSLTCPGCSVVAAAGSRFCASCGHALGAVSEMVTMPPRDSPAIGPGVSRLVSSDAVPVGGFAPGTVLSARYRVVGLLGRGGMGEVYRADDLKLGQPVALKFLPRALADDAVRRERLFAEVRIARQVSHPNICRVYDIAEIDEPAGKTRRHFLTMEFIDGEDLASLIKRIGHLSNEKALEITRQLAAGLAAAHDRGVLHRDLKPANVMIDGHGRVRITDFGLAVAAGDQMQADESGTPAYMAPEQLAGKGATVRSDIYALGLVLYEIYTGKKAFAAPTLAELREQKETRPPTAPSDLRAGIDPMVERLISRCLERDPRARPASVAQLAAALPGGDPLAAALAAGETPSPEMVAAVRTPDGVRPLAAWGLLAVIVLGTLAAMAINGRTQLLGRLAVGKTPEVLVERARELIGQAGYSDPPADSAYGFEYDIDFLRYVQRTDQSSRRWQKLEAYNPVLFWYRQSPRPLEVIDIIGGTPMGPGNPPARFSGELLVKLDADGRLRAFEAVPPQIVPGAGSSSTLDMSRFLSNTGVEASTWRPVEPQWNPPNFADTRAAWAAPLPRAPEIGVRVESAAYRNGLVSFEVIGPWTQPARAADLAAPTGGRLFSAVLLVVLIACLGGGLFYARRNVRLGRGDRRGAMRLAAVVIGIEAVGWLVNMHHVATTAEIARLFQGAAYALLGGGAVLVLYLALEPFARRRWPHMLVSWTRLLAGDWRDPVVGRDLLAGCAAGVGGACLINLVLLAPTWVGRPEPMLETLAVPLGFAAVVADLQNVALNAVGVALFLLFLLFLLRVVFRNEPVAAAAWILAAALIALTSSERNGQLESIAIAMLPALCWGVLQYVLIRRLGWLAFLCANFAVIVLAFYPITFQTSAWYVGTGYTALAVLAAIAIFGFWTSLGGQPLLGEPILAES